MKKLVVVLVVLVLAMPTLGTVIHRLEEFDLGIAWQAESTSVTNLATVDQGGDICLQAAAYNSQGYVWYEFNFPQTLENIEVSTSWIALGGYYHNRMEVNVQDASGASLAQFNRYGNQFTSWQVFNDTISVPGQHDTIKVRFVVANQIGDYTSRYSSFQVSGTVVPEPATVGLLCLGGLAALRRRK